jgi:cytochrome c-type biogenesis protein CcmE
MRRILTFWVPLALAVSACGSPTGSGGPHPISGKVEALTPPTLTVSGRVVTTTGATVITKSGAPVTMAALRVGEAVRVEAHQRGDDSLEADEIEVEDDGIEFRGTVDSLAAPKLFVSGHVVVTDSGTKIERDDQRIPLDSLQVGDTVKVEGQLQADSTVLASEIEVRHGEEHDGEEEHDSADVEVEGMVDSLAPPDLFVAGQTVVVDSATEMEHDGDTLTLASFHVGEMVRVEGVRRSDGSILARKLEPRD